MALLATVLLAALLAGLFFAVNEETRVGSAIAARDHSFAAAESALEAGIGHIRAHPPPASPVGTVASRSFEVGGRAAVVHTTRLDRGLFWLVAVVADERDAGAPSRRIGALAAETNTSGDSIRIVRVTRRGWSELF